MLKLKKLIKKVIVLVVTIMIICLVHQLVVFIYFNKEPEISINPLKIIEPEIKKTWRGNRLDIEAKTNIYICGQPTYVRFKENKIEIHELYCGGILRCWGYSTGVYSYKLYYNNIFSSLKAYFFDNIKISYIEHSDFYGNCDDVKNDEKYMKSKGFTSMNEYSK